MVSVDFTFLSDLCGREDKTSLFDFVHIFLSDLCGREGIGTLIKQSEIFLSDLCGREVLHRKFS